MKVLIDRYRRAGMPVEDLYLMMAVAAVGACCQALLLTKGVPHSGISPYLLNSALYISCLLIFISLEVLLILFLDRPSRPIPHLATHPRRDEHLRRLIRALPILLTLVVFMPLFSDMKSSIPLFHAYDWDPILIEMDRMLHGKDAWLLLQPILGYPIATSILSVFYHLWILLIYAGSIYFAVYLTDARLRFRYFVSFFAIWIVCGVILATLLASVGPCFASPILGIDTFKPQMDYLNEANTHYPVMVLDIQQELLAWHRLGSYGLGRGITAMPSMHVSLAFLFFLAIRRISRALALVFGAFFGAILVGSVHLGYHYAVDGYVGIAVTWVIWRLSELLARKVDWASPPTPAIP